MIDFLYFWRGAPGMRTYLPGEDVEKELTLLFVGKTVTLPIRDGLILVAYADAQKLEPEPYYLLRRKYAEDEPIYGCAAIVAVDADGKFRSVTDEDEADAKSALLPTAAGLSNSVSEQSAQARETPSAPASRGGRKNRAVLWLGLLLLCVLIGLFLCIRPGGAGTAVPTAMQGSLEVPVISQKGADGCV